MEHRKTILPPSIRPRTLPISHRNPLRKAQPPKIMLTRGALTAPTRPLRPHSRILVLMFDDPLGYLKGMLLVPNEELGRRTNGKTTHAVFESILDLQRAFRHMRLKSGMSRSGRWGEFQILDEDETVTSAAIATLLDSGILPPELEQALRSQVDQVIRDLRLKRNELKLLAGKQLARAKNPRDRRGRRNIGAAKAAAAAAKEKFGKRRAEILRILSFLDLRGKDVTATIVGIRSFGERFHEFLLPLPSGAVSVHPDKIRMLFEWLLANAPAVVLIERLEGFASELQRIDVLPFLRNASRCVADVRGAIDALCANDVVEVRRRLLRLRRGVRWLSILFRLERPLAKTAFLIGWLKQNAAARKRHAIGAITVEEEHAGRLRHYTEIHRLIRETLTLVRQASDEGLDQPVKAKVLAHVEETSQMGETMLAAIHRELSAAIALL